MSIRLTIRPKIIEGESLSSYLLRIADANKMLLVDILKLVDFKFKKVNLKDAIQVDLNYVRALDFSILSSMLCIPRDQLDLMTFTPLYKKFLSGDEMRLVKRDFIQNVITTDKRFFCPLCLEEDLIFKLIWQIKEISICVKHFCRLQEKCDKCGESIPYLNKSIIEGKCSSCNAEFMNRNIEYVNDDQLVAEQLQYYKDWEYLLNPNINIIQDIAQSKRKSLAIKLFYVAQNQESKFYKQNISIISRENKNLILRFIKDQKSRRRITLPFLLLIIRELGISLDRFSEIRVPDSYIESIINDEPKELNKNEIGSCKSPWCKSFGSVENMRMVNIISKEIQYRGKVISSPFICLGCYVKYGFDNTKTWIETEFLIELGWNYIRPLLNQGFSILAISKVLEIKESEVRKMAIFLSCHNLLEEPHRTKFTPTRNIENPVFFFKKLYGGKGNNGGINSVKKLFGWSVKDYWYYYYMPDVQEYLFIEMERNKGPIKKQTAKEFWSPIFEKELTFHIENQLPISNKIIADAMGCSERVLVGYKFSKEISRAKDILISRESGQLWGLTKRFVDNKRANKEEFSYQEYYDYIGKTKKYLTNRFPDILSWIKIQKKEVSDYRHKCLIEEQISLARKAVKTLVVGGMKVEFQKVAEMIGIKKHNIKGNNKIGVAINDEIKKVL